MESVISASMVVLLLEQESHYLKVSQASTCHLPLVLIVAAYNYFPFIPIAQIFGFIGTSSFVFIYSRNNCINLYYYGGNSKEDIL